MDSPSVVASAHLPYILTPQEAHAALSSSSASLRGSPRTIPLYAAWFFPNDPFIPKDLTSHATFIIHRIPNSVFWDFVAASDPDATLPHTAPPAAQFAAIMSTLGITRSDRVIVYDSAERGLLTAPRVAWLLRAFGHPQVHVLDNFHLWLQQGLPIESGAPPNSEEEGGIQRSEYPLAEFNPTAAANFEEVSAISTASGNDTGNEKPKAQLLDARFASMFHGKEPDATPGNPSGHVPNATNVPWDRLLDPETLGLRTKEELVKLFEECGVDRDRPVVSMCHVGITAAILDAACEKTGFGGEKSERRIFDGSWTEWARKGGEIVEQGP